MVALLLTFSRLRGLPALLMALLWATTGGAPAALGQTAAGMALHLPHAAWLTTDTLWFSVLLPDAPRVQVVHAELATPAGVVVRRLHLPADGQPLVAGAFLPDDSLAEGGYQLRAFTGQRYAARFVWLYRPDTETAAAGPVAAAAAPPPAGGLRVVVAPAVAPRQPVVVTLQDSSGRPWAGRFALAVVRGGDPLTPLPAPLTTAPPADTATWQVKGQVVSSSPRPFVGRVTLSHPAPDADYLVTFADTTGRFSFPPAEADTPTPARRAILRAVGADDAVQLVVSSDQLAYPGPAALLPTAADTAGLSAWLQQVRRRHRIMRQFYPVASDTAAADFGRLRPYNAYTRSIPTSDLPPMVAGVDYIRDAIMEVRVLNKNRPGRRQIRMLNATTKLYYKEPPLLLLDGIPTDDVEALLSLPGHEIVALEMIMAPLSQYEFGFEGRNGVLALYTQSGQYAPRHPAVRVLNATGFSVPPAFVVPPVPTAPTLPHLREVVYWSPLTEGAVRFQHPDETGTFRVRVAGVTDQGEVVTGEATYQVVLP